MEEIWRDIPGYEEFYQASSEGRIRSKDRYTKEFNNHGTMCRILKKGRMMRVSTDADGYFGLQLYDADGKPHDYRINRLIAITFLPNPDELSQVDHINGNKQDNRAVNLEWVSCKENIRRVHAYGDTRLIGRVGIICKCIEDDLCFVSAAAAADHYNIHPSRIYSHLFKNTKIVVEGRELHFARIDLSSSEYKSAYAQAVQLFRAE